MCHTLATLTRQLCTEYIDPTTTEPILSSRLIPLDKGNSEVRTIGVGEVIRRIIGKCVTKVSRQDIQESSGSLHVCAGYKSGSEAAVHAMHSLFQHEESDAVLLEDASNAFNSLNRAAALHNIRVLYPALATFAINTHRAPARLFAMSMHALSLQPLISHLQAVSQAKQCWFADDATGCGSLQDIRLWWDELIVAGSDLGYYPNAGKCWHVLKADKEETAKSIFEGTAMNITTERRKHLGAALGSRSYLEQYINGKVKEWVEQVTQLSEFALSQPQASYAAFTVGLKHRWAYFLRTLPYIEDLLAPLEVAITDALIPSITGHNCTQVERELLALPVRMGGMGLTNPSQVVALECVASTKISGPLAQQIKSQTHEPPDDNAINAVQREMRQVKNQYLKERIEEVKCSISGKTLRAVDLATQKGASSWLTVLPIRDMDFDLNKSEFRDAVKLRYQWEVPDTPSVCVFGDMFSVDHAMICKRGRFVNQRHNELRDLEAELLSMVCKDVEVEPVLQDIAGEELEPTPSRMRGWIGDSGRGRGRPFLILGFATRMLTPIETWIQTRYSGNMKQRRSASTPVE